MLVAALAFVAVREQCPPEVTPVTVTVSLVAEVVVSDAVIVVWDVAATPWGSGDSGGVGNI